MVIIHKAFVILLCLVVITSLSFTVFATGEQPTGSNYSYVNSTGTTSTSDYWSASNNNLKQIALWLANMRGTSFWYFNGSNSYGTGNFFDAVTKSLYYIGLQLRNGSSGSSSWTTSDVATVTTYVPSIYSQLVSIDGRLITSNSTLTNIYNKLDSIKTDTGNLLSIKGYLSDLHDIFASQEDLALKNDQATNVSSATSNFLSGTSSSTSVGVSDIGNMKSIGDDVATLFDTGVSGTSIFGLVSDTSANGPWSWFSQATLDSLSPSNSGQRRSTSDSSGGEVVDFYSDKMAELDRLLGTVSKDD